VARRSRRGSALVSQQLRPAHTAALPHCHGANQGTNRPYPERLQKQLELVAGIDGISVAQVVRAAIVEHVVAREEDDAFQSKRARVRREQLIDELAF
jgi:hypothetical protein